MIYAIPILAIILILIIIAAALMTSESKTLKVSEILQITHTKSLAESTNTGQNETIMIKTLGLKITAIGGDAHSIIVIVSSHQDPWGPPVKPFLPKDESWDLPIDQLTLPTRLNEDGFYEVTVSVKCIEAAEAEHIILYLEPEDILLVPGLPT